MLLSTKKYFAYIYLFIYFMCFFFFSTADRCEVVRSPRLGGGGVRGGFGVGGGGPHAVEGQHRTTVLQPLGGRAAAGGGHPGAPSTVQHGGR